MASSIVITTTTTTTTTTATALSLESSTVLPLSTMWGLISSAFQQRFVVFLNCLEYVPGGSIVLRYIKSSYQNDPFRSLLEFCLVLFALSYFLSSKKKENKSELVKFSPKEIDELCAEWEPRGVACGNWQLKSIPEITGHNGAHVNLNGKQVVNLASQDFLNLNENENVKEAARVEIKYAGVGACGPPNFYGTQDAHVRLEEDLARYLECEQAIIYGQDFVTAGSVIPAFLKRGDLCVVDSGVNIALQKALIVSRADIEWYDHNDIDHLEQILSQLKPVLDKQKPIRRRFIVTEGLFASSGDIANLPRIVELKNKFKYRLFLDESLSIGVLGDTGKGLTEHFGISRDEVSITIGSMANSFASSGGFCVGVNPMVHHQRISSNAYVFSASLPPYSAKVTSQAIREILENVDSKTGKSILMGKLHDLTRYAYESLDKQLQPLPFQIVSSPQSPLIHIGLKEAIREQLGLPLMYGNSTFITTGKPAKSLNAFDEYLNLESFILQKIIDYVLEHADVLITRTKLILDHENLPVVPPHLLGEVARLVEVLPKAIKEVFGPIQSEDDLFALSDDIINY
ncbi:Serine palmitoyltransferase 1 [Candida viswanathii]|uniref:serine C-palmitoyltransferase n=1 Tax=Candida viswanathii TaxID=5486 RepID=A0A367YBE5_9ASCO|nr:Serine palmitoyltransferase 1 [Candida viswanathii]